MATFFIYGRQTVLEYVEPKNVRSKAVISISKVVHSYRSIVIPDAYNYSVPPNGFPPFQSFNCEVNINCPQGVDCQMEKHAVALVVNDVVSACTGFLVQNTAQDSKPYLMTANHCFNAGYGTVYDAVSNPSAPSWMVYWNYEGATCTNSVSSGVPTSAGMTVLTNSGATDFALLRLTEDPKNASGANPYYLGWSRLTTGPSSSVGIHHPAADIKKISFDNSQSNPYPASFITAGPNALWQTTWNVGSMEHGSSG